MPVTVQPLTPELLKDWLYFFDNIAFADNPDWSACYCTCYQVNCSTKEWSVRTKEQNRDWAQQAIKDGMMRGYLAYEDEQPVGWCSVNRKKLYAPLIREKELTPDAPDDGIVSVMCFVIAATHRGKGIARQLLRQAMDDCSKENIPAMEAYPYKGELSPGDQFHGPLQLFLSEGFTVYRDFERFVVVRKQFKAE
ncbi:MAG TPA: GNAT family N-acetyltransferase [Chitinophagales bacterium]|nr:GNAT family N-acetyltransferase [Chitinophagales bacterium]